MSDPNFVTTAGVGTDAVAVTKGIVGAVVGGVAGYFLFVQLCSINLYAFMLPGAFVGLGCGWLGKSRSVALSVFCFIFAVVVSVLGEWQTLWFIEDESLEFFVKNIHKSRGGFALFAVILNGAIAAWLGRRGSI